MNPTSILRVFGKSTLGRRFTFITIMFLTVLLGIMFYTTMTIQKQKSNAILIDMAGRQRMLFEKHLNEVYLTSQGITADYKSTRELLRSTLASLMKGGSVTLDPETGRSQTIPEAPTEEILLKLQEQVNHFDKVIESSNGLLMLAPDQPEFHRTLQTLRARNSTVIKIADDAVKQLDRHSELSIATMVKRESIAAFFVALLGVFITSQVIRASKKLENEIDERKRAETDLRATEQMYRQILDSIPDMVFMKDQNFRMLWGNKAFRSYYNMTNGELKGILDAPFNEPEYTKDYNKDDTYVLNKGEVLDIPEEPVTRYDGQVRYFHTIKAPLLGESGEVVKLVGVARDITEGKEDKDALKESEERFRLLNEAIPQQVWTAKPDGSLDYVNQRVLQYFGCSFEEIIDQGWERFLHPDDLPGCLERWAKARDTKQPYEIEFRLLGGKDHSFLWHLGRALPIFDQDGQVVKWFGTNTDITQFKQLEDQIRQSQKMEAIGTLAGGIAHDFNNILMAITGYAELATFNSKGNTAAQRNLDEVLVAGQRAKELVQQILAFSRQTDLERQSIALQSVVKEVCKFLRASLPATVEIRQSLTKAPTIILGDPIQMHQVVMNLCANAEHAMRESGGLLELKVDRVTGETNGNKAIPPDMRGGSFIRLTVRDTGAGMTPEVTRRIFDPFFTTKGVGEGTGMGLAVVHGIVTSHGGRINVESEPGVGTTVTIDFPEVEATNIKEATKPVEPELLRGHGYILFVEDEESLAKLGEEALKSLGYEVRVCTSSIEALEAFRAEPFRFDAVVTDQTMPKMTGEVLSRELLHIRPEVPIILCTGFSHSMTQQKAQAMGIRAFLLKPLLIKDLGRNLQEVLNIKNV